MALAVLCVLLLIPLLLLLSGGGVLRDTPGLTNPTVPYLELELVLTFFAANLGADSMADLDLRVEWLADPRGQWGGGDGPKTDPP